MARESGYSGDTARQVGDKGRTGRVQLLALPVCVPVDVVAAKNHGKIAMGFDQYHEPPEELPPATRTFARMIASLIEEAEAIGWYEQRLAVEKDRQARAIMKNAQHEEMKHFGMDLEFLLRKKKNWRETLRGILFKQGDIVEHGDEAEESSEDL